MMNRLLNSLPFSIPFLYTLLTTVSALPSGIWVITIDNDPSPSAEDGPAFDRNAIRDPAYLPLEVGSIVGAYLLWIIFLSIAILTIGRRLRRQVQTSPRTLNMEIVRPDPRIVPVPQPLMDSKEIATEKIFEVTPVSPTKDASWSIKSWNSMRKNNNRSAAGSVVTFDESVLSDDRTRNEMEMDRLYAAVAVHEAQRSQPSSPPLPSLPMTPLNQNPPEFQHLRYPGTSMHHDSGLLPSPPPEDDIERSPSTPKSSKRGQKPSPLNLYGSPSRGSSRSSFSSFASFGRKKTSSVRGLPISPPMGSPEMNADSQHLDSAPLSPRHYRPGPPPTPPANPRFDQEALASPLSIDQEGRKFYFSPGIRSSRASVSTFGYSPSQTPRTATFPVYPPPTVQEEQQQYSNAIAITIDPSSAAPTPRAVPSTPLPTIQTQAQSQAQTSTSQPQPPASPTNYSIPRFHPPRTGSTDTTRRPKPAPLSLGTASNSSQTTLPLRTAPLPLRSLRSPNSTRPISQIKITELTRPDPASQRKGGLLVPGTAGMVPATPYSPFYMPMTPLTPMTPSRLVTREERRRAKKEEGRRVLTQEDMVVNEEDMWGEGY